jgi:hypothetical protein
MGRKKIYDSRHQQNSICNWKNYGLICREGETYKGIYSLYMNTDFCNKCNVKFNNDIHNEKRCMDHSHSTGFFRQVLCHKCNKHFDRKKDMKINKSKTGHRWISPNIRKKNKVYVSFVYKREGFKRKDSTSLTKLICLSFINILKEPI